MVLKRDEHDKSLVGDVLPYDICIDAYPLEDRPPPPGHACITQRLERHGMTLGCPGCEHGHAQHIAKCRARFDAIYKFRTGAPTPASLPPTPAVERASPSRHPTDPMDDELVPECRPARPDRNDEDHGRELPAAKLPRSRVLATLEALQTIRREFDGVASMGTWDWFSVAEAADAKRTAIEKGKTINLAHLVAICSEKHLELDPSFTHLRGRVCFKRNAAETESGNIALYQKLSASPASIVGANAIVRFGFMKECKVTTADAVKACLQVVCKPLHTTWVRLPREAWPASWFGPTVQWCH